MVHIHTLEMGGTGFWTRVLGQVSLPNDRCDNSLPDLSIQPL